MPVALAYRWMASRCRGNPSPSTCLFPETRAARSDVLRRALVDVRDLDALIDRWRQPETAPEARRG
jgi:hypothetical protein